MRGGLVAGLLGFALLAVDELVGGPMQSLDRHVNGLVSQEVVDGEPVHVAGQWMSLPGSGWLVTAVVALCSGWMLWRREPILALWCASIGLATVLVVTGLKQFFESPRPPLFGRPTTYSFPSGHTFAATAALGAAIILSTEVFLRRHEVPRFWVPVVWAGALVVWSTLAAVTGIGRVLAQVHWVSDVVASWFLGVAAVSAILFVLSGKSRGGDRGPDAPETAKPKARKKGTPGRGRQKRDESDALTPRRQGDVSRTLVPRQPAMALPPSHVRAWRRAYPTRPATGRPWPAPTPSLQR